MLENVPLCIEIAPVLWFAPHPFQKIVLAGRTDHGLHFLAMDGKDYFQPTVEMFYYFFYGFYIDNQVSCCLKGI